MPAVSSYHSADITPDRLDRRRHREAEHVPAPPGLYTFSTHIDSWVVRAHKPVSYEVRLCDNLFDPQQRDLADAGDTSRTFNRRFVVIDSNVDLLHGDRLRHYFKHHNIDVTTCVVTANETTKQFDTVARVVRELDSFDLPRRHAPITAIGGGVLLDIVGFASSLYRRGTPYIRVPTTLLGLVDAGIGVKTGVNFNGHKNRIGTYCSSDLTLLDRTFLATLDRRHISNGLAEVLKMALIKDKALFELLESHASTLIAEKLLGATPTGDQIARNVLRRAIHSMLSELQPNLWEKVLERAVDYGHTFSPTIEMRGLPEFLHGEAVCLDMALTTIVACQRGLVSVHERDRIFTVMHGLGLPTWDSILTPSLLGAALHDTIAHRDGQQRLPLPVGIGDVTFVNDVICDEVVQALHCQRQIGQARHATPVPGATPRPPQGSPAYTADPTGDHVTPNGIDRAGTPDAPESAQRDHPTTPDVSS